MQGRPYGNDRASLISKLISELAEHRIDAALPAAVIERQLLLGRTEA